MTTGLLNLAAGELAHAMSELERWNPNDCSRREARVVAGLLRIGINRGNSMLRKWEGRVGNMQTTKLEAQDISEGDTIHFPKQDETREVTKTEPSPVEEGYLRIHFPDFELDVDPSEEFDVVLSDY